MCVNLGFYIFGPMSQIIKLKVNWLSILYKNLPNIKYTDFLERRVQTVLQIHHYSQVAVPSQDFVCHDDHKIKCTCDCDRNVNKVIDRHKILQPYHIASYLDRT